MGYDPVEEHGVPPGVTVTSAGDAYAPTVAEHAVAMLLALLRRIPEAVAQRRAAARGISRTPCRSAPCTAQPSRSSASATSDATSPLRLRGFGARVIAVTRSGRADPLADEAASAADLHAVLGRSDAVVLAVPLNARTRHLLGARALAALRPHAIVINIARGGVIDHAALREALAQGRLGGAGLDVTEPEPLPADDPLWTMPNVLITPHVAGYGGDVAPRRILALVERNLESFTAGRPLEALVPVEPRAR